MKISDYMTRDPIIVSGDMFLPEARRILNEYHIRHLPVINSIGELAGIVTDRDLRSAYPSSVTTKAEMILAFEQVEKTTIADIMTTTCTTLGPDATIDDALLVFDKDKVGGIPIVSDENKILGFFSLLDLTAAYRKLFGMYDKGSILIGIRDDGRKNILCELVTLLAHNNIILTRLIRLEGDEESKQIFIRISAKNPQGVYALLKEKRFVILDSQN